MKKRVLSLALLMSAGAQLTFAQSGRTVTGTVLEPNGQPAIGASVETIDGKMSTQTGVDGTFEMEIPEGASNQLKISYIGYSDQTVTAAPGKNVQVKFTQGTNQLDGVVVTGYRNYTKEKYVGAADRITSQQIEKMPVADVTKAIEGAAPGVQVTSGSGQPGSGASVQVRGNSSISGNGSPLYVVDGAPYFGDITSINALDIENLTILKDATATSLYGSRGANGVIVITTKSGKSNGGKNQINVDLRTGIVQRGLPNYKVMTSAKDYYEKMFESYTNNLMYGVGYSKDDAYFLARGLDNYDDGLIGRLGGYNSYDVPADELIGADGKLNPNANLRYNDDWDKEISRVGTRNEANINFSGSTGQENNTDYYFSLGYLKENGFIKYSDYERFSGRMNINSKVNNYLTVGLNLSGTYSIQQFLTASGTSSANPMFISKDFAPIIPVYYYDANGNREQDPITGGDKYDWGAKSSTIARMANSSIGDRPGLQGENVLGSMSLNTKRSNMFNIVAVPYIKIDFSKKFSFLNQFNYNYYNSSSIDAINPYYGQYAGTGGNNYRENYQIQNYTLRQQLNYNDSKDKHTWGAFAVHESFRNSNNLLSASGRQISIPGNTNLNGVGDIVSINSYDNEHRLESYMVGANYDFDNTYFLEGSMRWDGSSRFSPEARWNKTPFWAIGGGWDMRKADFFENIAKVMSRAKLKASYGLQGNENLGSWYIWQSLYNATVNNGAAAGATISNIGNADLTWEAQKQLNIGLEFGFFNNRLTGEVNYFNKNNSDLLYNVPVAPSMGITTKPMNALTMMNQGVELTLVGRIVEKENFNWTSTLNLTHYTNEITKMTTGLDSVLAGNFMYKKGHSMYDFYLVESAGVDKTNGNELYYNYDADGNKVTDSVYANVATSGRTFVGSAIPDLYGSWTNQFSFKGFDVSVLLSFGIGGKYYDGVYASLMHVGGWGKNWHQDILNSWTPENPNSEIPRVEINNINNARSSSRWLTDASYLNIRNITLGYTIPSKVVEKLKIQGIRVYALVDNVHIFSNRQGMNPQSSFAGSSDYSYTPARTIMLGAKFTL